MQDKEFLTMLERSRQVKKHIAAWYQANVSPKTRLSRGQPFDLYCPPVGHVKVREDRLAGGSQHYSFEYEDASGKPAGIAATPAGEFVIVDGTHVVILKTLSLLFLIKDCPDRRIIRMGFTTKEGKRSWGYLVPRNYIINSPYSRVLKRWF